MCVFKHVRVIVCACVCVKRACVRVWVHAYVCVRVCLLVCAHLSYRAPLWGRDPTIHQENEDVPGEMPLGHCDSVGYVVQCRHTGGDWRAANQEIN